jgi:hypothetical protein
VSVRRLLFGFLIFSSQKLDSCPLSLFTIYLRRSIRPRTTSAWIAL